jgi:hypothetical protein
MVAAAKNTAAASISAGFSAGCVAPLDTLRVRWQVQHTSVAELSFTAFARQKVSEGVVQGLLLPGLAMNVGAIACCSGIRFALYPYLRDTLDGILDRNHNGMVHGSAGRVGGATGTIDKSPLAMVTSGFVSGAIGYFISTPLWALKVQAQAHPELCRNAATVTAAATAAPAAPAAPGSAAGVRHVTAAATFSFSDLWGDGGVRGLFRGASPLVVRGACLSAGNMLGYDGTKSWFKQHHYLEDGVTLHIAASIVSAACATLMGAPADNAMTLVQTARQRAALQGTPYSPSVNLVIVDMVKTRGFCGFYRGWPIFFARMAPAFAINLVAYEQIRRLLGLDYLD